MNYSVDQDPNRTFNFGSYVLYIIAIFSGGLLAIIASLLTMSNVVMCKGSIFESHFTWQIPYHLVVLAWNIIAFIPIFFLFLQGTMPMLLQVSHSQVLYFVGS